MIEALILTRVRNDPDIAGMLALYAGNPAFFYQKAPPDGDREWETACFPRMDYSMNWRRYPERRGMISGGTMSIRIWCTAECSVMPEDIEKKLVKLLDCAICSDGGNPVVCLRWSRTDAFDFEAWANRDRNTAPEVFGLTVQFDIMEFPEQTASEPDPIRGLNDWTLANNPDAAVITRGILYPVTNALYKDGSWIWKPSDEHPLIYWRCEGISGPDRQSSAVTWHNGQFAGHVISGSLSELNRRLKFITEGIRRDGEIILRDGSPMFIKDIVTRHGTDPLIDGQLLVTGAYGVLGVREREIKLRNINFHPAMF